ncbi:MAG: aminopeptidase, partial [Candidatus Latescibacteria bacterium]|nr:aminopeptidase [Candidatus Latescibacterota bacterium]
DPRLDRLAEVLTCHSTELQPGETVLIEAFDVPDELVVSIMRAASARGARPMVSLKHNRVLRELYMSAEEPQMAMIGDIEKYRMEKADAYIGVRGTLNVTELSDVSNEQMSLYKKHWWHPVHTEIRVRETKWVVLRYPTPSMAQQASMSTEAFEDFYFQVCTMDYEKMSNAMAPLVELLDRTDEVRIVGSGTDLRFSIAGIPTVSCGGDRNIPDGEVFTSPVKDSVSGTISFNAKTINQGITFENITLSFEAGKIVEASAGDKTEALNSILDTDEGARYIGEFAIGCNPYITEPLLDPLFDEKIAGSFHFTPGNAYDEADNSNRSQVHWDMVMLQDEGHGGGEMFFDGVLVRQDGIFVLDELAGLNPETVMS